MAKYRNPKKLLAEIPARCRITRLPRLPFVGELSYAELVHILRQQRRWFSRPERILVDLLTDYLEYKQANRPGEIIPELPCLEFD